MDRRQFCRTSVAAGVAAALPSLYGCERQAEAPMQADTSIPAISLDGAEIELEKAAVNELGESLSGELMLSGHPAYDEARKIWNGMHDKRPALIASCINADDVSNAVTFARERNLLVAVRGGGHSWPGKSVCDGGIMIDLAQMRGVTVDPDARRAYAQGGALLNTLDTASLEHGLITTAGVVSHTGIGGFTLGGGFGRLNRKYGLAIDNLRAATIVTADGRVRTITEEREPDLFWAIRGGGGNFGVVTEFVYELYPFERQVLSGMLVWPVEQARDVLEFYAEWQAGLGDDMYAGPVMAAMPDGTGIVAMEVVYAGDPADGEKVLEPLRNVGTMIDDGVKVQDYMVLQTHEDEAFGFGVRSYAKSGMISEINQAFVDTMIDVYVPDPRYFIFTHTAGGAMNRIGELETAFPHRNAETMLGIAGVWENSAEDSAAIAKVREWYSAFDPFIRGYYDNIEFDRDANTGNYGPAYSRLSRIKGEFDPGNLFRLNSNIKPTV